MGVYAEALRAGHTVSVRANFSGVVFTDKIISGKTLITDHLNPEKFQIRWSGTDVIVTDDSIRDFVIGEKIRDDRLEAFNQSLGVVVTRYEPEWFRHFKILEGAEPSAPGQGKKVSIYDRAAIGRHFKRALNLDAPVIFKKELEAGCPVDEFAVQVPLLNLSCALAKFAEEMGTDISSCAEIRQIEIATAPVYAN